MTDELSRLERQIAEAMRVPNELLGLANHLVTNQTSLPEEFYEVLAKHFWDLCEGEKADDQ